MPETVGVLFSEMCGASVLTSESSCQLQCPVQSSMNVLFCKMLSLFNCLVSLLWLFFFLQFFSSLWPAAARENIHSEILVLDTFEKDHNWNRTSPSASRKASKKSVSQWKDLVSGLEIKGRTTAVTLHALNSGCGFSQARWERCHLPS